MENNDVVFKYKTFCIATLKTRVFSLIAILVLNVETHKRFLPSLLFIPNVVPIDL